MDRVVCRPFSVLCSLDIVKRVVTVKQVRPSSCGMRSGLGMGMRECRCASIGGAVPAHRFQAARSGADDGWTGALRAQAEGPGSDGI